MAFRKKADFILTYEPDILIVPECEHPDKLKFNPNIPEPKDILWFGTNQNKGLGIFSYSDFRFKLMDNHNPELRMIIPIAVTGGGYDFTLLAIWAMDNKENHEARYIGQVWLAINYYKDILGNSTIIIGDFNSNKIWDYKDRVGTHSDVVNKLADKNINSAYHKHFGIEQGIEKHPTFFLHKKIFKPYHIDYCFASKDLIDKLQSVEVGEYDFWMQYSDHVPVIVSFDLN
jgi:hypothetical protein